MGEYSALYLTNDVSLPVRGGLTGCPYLLSKYHIPLLWLALFSDRDIRDVEDPDDGALWPYLVKRRQDAVEMLHSRIDVIESAFPGLQRRWVDQFMALLNTSAFGFVHLATSEIGSMSYSGPEWREKLATLLDVFDRASAGNPAWAPLNELFEPAYTGDAAGKPWSYCGGSGTGEEMEWEKTS
jgi:hypothetical protein